MEPTKLTVLAIDDSAEDLDTLGRHLATLEEWDFDLITCATIEEAQAAATDPEKIDMIFLPHELGSVTGVDVLRKILELDHLMPVFLLAGQSDTTIAVSAMKAGAADYIKKSKLSPNLLRRSIGNALERRDLQRTIENHQRDLEESNKHLMRKNEEIQRFYHELSHEMKTPLTSALEFISITLEGIAGPVTDEQCEFLQMAKESCEQIKTHINDLLDIARLETGKLYMERRPGDLGAVAKRAEVSFVKAASDRGIEIICETQPDLPMADIDETRMTQVFANLISNALKFTPSGGTITVEVGRHPERANTLFASVRDTGCGIEPGQLEAIFDRLFQVREGDAAVRGGLGLGLNLCREIVRNHGGEIWAESEEGQGSTFFFTVTLSAAEGAMRILVVDDERTVRDVVCDILADGGFNVSAVASGEEALEALESDARDLLLVDLKMQGMSGPETLRRIRNQWGDIPAIILTGYPDSDLVGQALEYSPVTLMSKPCRPHQLIEAVKQMQRKARLAAN